MYLLYVFFSIYFFGCAIFSAETNDLFGVFNYVLAEVFSIMLAINKNNKAPITEG